MGRAARARCPETWMWRARQVIAEYLEAFLDAVAQAGDGLGLPHFVEREFPGSSCYAGCSRPASRGFSARSARASISYRFHAKEGRRVRAVGAGG